MSIESSNVVVSFEHVVKSDSNVEQRVYFVRGLQRRGRASIKERLFDCSMGLRESSVVYFVRGETNGVFCSRTSKKGSSLD